MKKFNNVKTYYRRDKKCCMQLKSGSAGIGFKPQGEHYSRLVFLSDICTAEDSRNNLLANEENEANSQEKHSLIDFEEGESSNLNFLKRKTGEKTPGEGESSNFNTPMGKKDTNITLEEVLAFLNHLSTFSMI